MVDPHPDAELLQSLREQVDARLYDVLDGARDVALVNFPNHGNPGDPAIWLGARAALRRLGVRVRYRCAWYSYDPVALRRALPDGPVLVNGGGNFGDLYQGQQGLRERLLAELTERSIVQLPQSIHFRERSNLQRMQDLISRHGRVTIMVREPRSETFARQNFKAPVVLAPDLALAMSPRDLRTSKVPPRLDRIVIHRRPGDPEFVDHGAWPDDEAVEWLHTVEPEPRWRLRPRIARRLNDRLRPQWAEDRPAPPGWRLLAATFDPLAQGYVERGVSILDRGRVVVTDKLHGHVLALLAGIPNVVMDNSYGKVSAVYERWTSPSTITRWASSAREATELARELAATEVTA